MESIIIYPKNAKQKKYYAKLDKSISQAEAGKTKCLPKDKQKEFLGI